jgi:hypothetical protein
MTEPIKVTTNAQETFERHLSEKIDAVETSLKSQIGAVETNLTDRIIGVEKFFTAENRAAKDAVSIAMTAAEKAAQKTEVQADERSRNQTASYTTMLDGVMKRLDQIDKTIAESGGWQHGVGASMAVIFQIVSSIGVIVGLIVLFMHH